MSENKDDAYYRSLTEGNPAPPELLEKLAQVGDGATIHKVAVVALILGQAVGKSSDEVGELLASMLLELGFRRRA